MTKNINYKMSVNFLNFVLILFQDLYNSQFNFPLAMDFLFSFYFQNDPEKSHFVKTVVFFFLSVHCVFNFMLLK